MKNAFIALVAISGFCWIPETRGDPPGGEYCVIDLAGGGKGGDYKVDFSDGLPADFGSGVYKTKKILLKWIEPGTFSMGQILEATPIRDVTISAGFYIGVYEVTQAHWRNVKGTGPFHFDGESANPAETISWEDIRGESGKHDWPAKEKVSPESFVGVLMARTGGDYRIDLPTEAQWEYACRAGTDTWWSFGKDRAVADDHSWSTDNSDDTTQEVGMKQPNPWGLYDMHGNVWEWCLDRFGPYPREAQTDPAGVATGWYRVWRGGGWDCSIDLHRSAHRNGGTPGTRAFHVGFRLVVSPK